MVYNGAANLRVYSTIGGRFAMPPESQDGWRRQPEGGQFAGSPAMCCAMPEALKRLAA